MLLSDTLTAPNRPCGNCPWRLDVEPGEFTVERYRALAPCAYDRSFVIFQCHKSTDEKPVACAGFLSRSADHNLAIRLAYSSGRLKFKDRSGGLELHSSFRSLAVANGVAPGDCCLRDCRDSDDTATAAANEDLPVPKDCQARAGGIAQDHAHD